MSVKQCEKEYRVENLSLNIVICVYHNIGLYRKSPVNEMLETLQLELKKERKEYKNMQVAYVYETKSLLDVKEFQELQEDTPIYYKEPCDSRSMTHKLSHVWFMALALLEQQVQKMGCNCENRIYFITDEQFDRVETNQLIFKENGEWLIHPRFSDLEFTPILVRTKNAGGGSLEEYINNKNSENVRVI